MTNEANFMSTLCALLPNSYTHASINMTIFNDANRTGSTNANNTRSNTSSSTFHEGQRASAIAQVAALPTDVGPISSLPRPTSVPRATAGTTTSRANQAADEALQTGDLQNVDGPGAEVKALFLEFLFGL
jgi:hypothetical protein